MSGVYQQSPRADAAFRLGELDPPKRFVAGADGSWPAGIPGTPGEPYYERPAGYWKGAVDWETINEPKFGFDAAQGNNTDGLIDPDTNVVKTHLPPDSRSFILGPLVDGFVPNHIGDAFTRIGYIEKDTRQFVLLGIIQGEWVEGLNDEVSGGTYPVWNGTSGQFTASNPSFTLDMALWFRNEMLKGRYVKNVSYNAVGGIPQQGIPDPDAPQPFGGNGVGGGSGNAGNNPDGTGPDGSGAGTGSGGDPTTGTEQGDPDDGKDPGENDLWGMTQAEAQSKYGGLSDEELAELGIVRNPDGTLREMTPEELKAERERQMHESARKAMMGIARLAGISYSKLKFIFDKISPMGKMLDNLIKGDSGVEAIDRFLDPLARAAGKFAGRKAFGGKLETASNVMFRYDKWLSSGGKKRVDVSNEVSAKEMKVLQNTLHKPGGFTTDKWLKTYMNHPPTHEEYAATKEDAVKIHAKYIQTKIDQVMTASGTGLSMTFHNNVKLDMQRFLASGGKDIQMTKTYKFASGGSVGDAENTVLGQLLIGMGVELDRFGTGNIAKTMTAIIGSKYGLRNVNRMYGGKAYAAPGMPMRLKVPSPGTVNESIGSFTAFLNSINDDGDFLMEDEKPILLEDKKRILREIRQPLKEIKELPKTIKLKGYRPNFKGKYSPQNTPDVTASKRSDQLVMAKNAEGQAWTVGDKYQKGWETTGRMNHVYARVGESDKFFEQITANNSTDVERKMQEHLNHVYHNKAMLKIDSNYESPFTGDNIDEQETYDNKINDPLFTKVAKRLKKEIDYEKKPAKVGYPNEAPPKIDPNTGMHPKFGKKYKYDKLDPISAKTMAGAPTGDPEIDANVKKAAKVKEDWRSDLKNLWLGSEREDWKKKLEEGMTTSDTFSYSVSGKGDVDLSTTGTGYSADGVHQLQNIEPMTNVSDPTNAGKKFSRTHGYGSNTYGAINQYDTQAKADAGIEATYWDNPVTAPLLDDNTNLRFSDYVWPFDRDATEAETNIAKAASKVRGENDCFRAVYPTNLSGNRHKATPVTTNATVGTDDDYNTVGLGLQFGQGADTRDPKFFVPNPVNTSEIDTVQILASLPTSDSITSAGSQLQLFYWSGDKPGFQSLYPASGGGYPFTKNQNDGWRPIAMKPSGETDSSVSSNLIDIEKPVGYEVGKVSKFSIQIPEWCRSTSTRFMFVQLTQNSGYDRLVIYSIGYQRRNALTINTTLADEKASAYVRVGNNSQMAPEERKKKLNDMLKASREYMLKSLGFASLFNDEVKISDVVSNDFDYQSVMQGSGKFGNSRFNDIVSLEKRQRAAGIRKPQQTKRRGKFRGYQRTGRDSKGMTTRARVNPKDIIGSI